MLRFIESWGHTRNSPGHCGLKFARPPGRQSEDINEKRRAYAQQNNWKLFGPTLIEDKKRALCPMKVGGPHHSLQPSHVIRINQPNPL